MISCENLTDEMGKIRYYTASNWMSEIMKNKVLIIPPDSIVFNRGLLNGLLIKNSVEIINWFSETEYIVPHDKSLYLTSFKAVGLFIDDVELEPWENNSLEVFSPLILPGGSKIHHKEKYVFTGYLRNY